MTKSEEYKKLSGKKSKFFGLFGFYSLYLGSDHLLTIDTGISSEKYKRFYYSDIQAIIARKKNNWYGVTATLFISSILLFLMSYVATDSISIHLQVISALLCLILLFYIFSVPSIECYLKTAIQTEKLPSLYRISTYNKAMTRLLPTIEHTQGSLTPEQIKDVPTKRTQDTPASNQIKSIAPKVMQYKGNWHKTMFYILFSFGIYHLLDLIFNNLFFLIMDSLLTTGLAIFVMGSLIRQLKSKLPGSIQNMTWATLGYVCVNFLIGYFIYLVFIIKHVSTPASGSGIDVIRQFSKMSSFDRPALLGYHIFSILFCLCLGFIGAHTISKFQPNHKPGNQNPFP